MSKSNLQVIAMDGCLRSCISHRALDPFVPGLAARGVLVVVQI